MANPTCAVCGKPVDPKMHVALKNKITKQMVHMHPACAKTS